MRRYAAGLLGGAAVFGCAQPGTPPGGEPDRWPPRVVEVVPAALDTLTDPNTRVVIRFDERISERLQGVRDWEEAVVVSPATSPHRVEAGRRRLRISLVDGWEPNRVYRVMVRPVFRDLFDNARVEPIDLVFSTGAPIPDAALAGFVVDRITGNPVADARVEAVPTGEDVPYITLTDTAGFFALPFIRAGTYDVRAWVDRDRNRERSFAEIQDSVGVTFGAADTAVVELALLRPDTTPARLARAEPVDSATVRLHFDDYFDVGAVDGEARLFTLPDSAPIGPAPLFHPSRLDSIRAAEGRAAAAGAPVEVPAITDADPARADTADTDTVEGAPPGRRQGTDRGAALPAQALILYAPGLLRPDSSYFVRVHGLTNIQGVPGGGGTTRFVMPPRPEPGDTVPPDTVPPDTVPPDTVPPDTVRPNAVPPGGMPAGSVTPPATARPGGSGKDGRDR